MKTLLLILFTFLTFTIGAQTFIEMLSPEDAQIILLEVDSIHKADVCAYKTDKKSEYQEWNLMWKIKKWGFSNFTIYIAKDTTELFVPAEESDLEMDMQYLPQGKIYFTDNTDEIRYLKKDFKIEGIMRVKKVGKLKLRKRDYQIK